MTCSASSGTCARQRGGAVMCKGLLSGSCTTVPARATALTGATHPADASSGRLRVTVGGEGPVLLSQRGLGTIEIAAGATLTVFVDDLSALEVSSPTGQVVHWACVFEVMDEDPVRRFQEYVRRAAQKKREQAGECRGR